MKSKKIFSGYHTMYECPTSWAIYTTTELNEMMDECIKSGYPEQARELSGSCHFHFTLKDAKDRLRAAFQGDRDACIEGLAYLRRYKKK